MFPTMSPRTRKLALTAHIVASVGWLGAALGFLVHAIAGLTSDDPETVRAARLIMELTGWFVLVPLSLAALATGIVQSLGTKWGLFRYYWVSIKFLLSVFATIILLIFMNGFGAPAGPLPTGGGGHHGPASPVVHAAGGLIVLIAAVALSVYKPWGTTPYWRRRVAKAGEV